MSDGGRGRVSLAVKMSYPPQKWSVQRSAVRSIAWLGAGAASEEEVEMQINPDRSSDDDVSSHIGECDAKAKPAKTESLAE